MQANQERLEPIFDALRAGRFDDYESLAGAFAKAHSKDALWSALAEAHGSAFDMFERLLAWPSDGTRVAMRRLTLPLENVVRS